MASKIVPIALVSVLVCLVQSKVGVEATTNYTSIAIVGNVYCRCKFAGYDSNVGGTPEKGMSYVYIYHSYVNLCNLISFFF